VDCVTVTKAASAALVAHQYARLRARMFDAVGNYEAAKQTFTDITASYRQPGRDQATADTLAAGDTRRQKAIADAQWFREEAAMYAAVVTAMRPDLGGVQ
jgi:hypothetical protein